MDEDKQIDTNVIKSLDQCRKFTPQGMEYWSARDLQQLLQYSKWSSFEELVERAKQSCITAGYNVNNHFADWGKMVTIGSSSSRNVKDYALSRLACYLIAMNGDTSKIEIATAQAYFTNQTRKQEIFEQLTDGEKRIFVRDRVKKDIKQLNGVAQDAGVVEFGLFHDAGYRGLYGGLRKKDIQKKKGISEKEELLDCIGRVELSINNFRLTQTEEKLKRDQIKGDLKARDAHKIVGQEVRNALIKMNSTMPEDLPREESIKKLQKADKKIIKELPKVN